MVVINLAIIQIDISDADVVGCLIVIPLNGEKENPKARPNTVEEGSISVEFQVFKIKLLGGPSTLQTDVEKLIAVGISSYPEEEN